MSKRLMRPIIKHDRVLNLVPQRLDRIQVRRIRWQWQQKAVYLRQHTPQGLAAVERCSIQNDGLSGPQLLNHLLREPGLDQLRITVPFECQRREDHATAPRGGHRHTRRTMSQPLSSAAGIARAPAVRIAERVVHPRFIYIHPVMRLNLAQLPQKFFSLGRIALGVGEALFLRVQPIFRSAREKVLRRNVRPGSCFHACAIHCSVQPL